MRIKFLLFVFSITLISSCSKNDNNDYITEQVDVINSFLKISQAFINECKTSNDDLKNYFETETMGKSSLQAMQFKTKKHAYIV